jgi:2,4-dienoyl-CoA reductase (NADPH2)
VLAGRVEVGRRVAVIGAGGIGFDVSEFLSDPHGELADAAPEPGMASEESVAGFCDEWGIDYANEHAGGLLPGVDGMPSSGRTSTSCSGARARSARTWARRRAGSSGRS